MIKQTLRWFRRHLRVTFLVMIVVGMAPAYLHAYVIRPGGVSEVPTILAGDTVIVNHAAYHLRLPYSNAKLFRTGSPRRGEMVLLVVPTNGRPAPKRVMGLPGDTIEFRENRLVVNGQPVMVKTLNRAEFTWVPDADRMGSIVEDEEGHWISYTSRKGEHQNHPPIRLAADQYFVLGDNRDESADSRVWGPISESIMIGRVSMILATGPRR